MGKSAKDHFEP